MKESDVPQDHDPTYEGHKRVTYAMGEQGDFKKVRSSGWTPEAVAKSVAWEDIHSKLAIVKKQVLNGEQSPLAYYMTVRLMELDLLAQNMGFFKWRVKKHLTPKGFEGLKISQLRKYAECLDLPVETLLQIPGQEESLEPK